MAARKFETADALRLRAEGLTVAATARALGVDKAAVQARLKRHARGPMPNISTRRWRARRAKIMAVIEAAAEMGMPAPTNIDIDRVCGWRSGAAGSAVHMLIRDGLVTVERRGGGQVRAGASRRFTVTATGKRTDWTRPTGGAGPAKGRGRKQAAESVKHARPAPSPERRGVYTLKGGSRPAGLPDAFLHGSHADAVRQVRRLGYAVVRDPAKRGGYLVNARPVAAADLREIADLGRIPMRLIVPRHAGSLGLGA